MIYSCRALSASPDLAKTESEALVIHKTPRKLYRHDYLQDFEFSEHICSIPLELGLCSIWGEWKAISIFISS